MRLTGNFEPARIRDSILQNEVHLPCIISGRWRRAASAQPVMCVLLALLVLVLGVALFSPLHTHSAAKKGGCSFNNLEHQFVALASALAVLLVILDLAWREPGAFTAREFEFMPSLCYGRAPPLLF